MEKRYVKFVAYHNGKRSFKLAKEDVTKEKLSLFSACDARRLCVKDANGSVVRLEDLRAETEQPYEVFMEKEAFENTWVRVCACDEFDSLSAQSTIKLKMKALRLPVHGRDVLVVKRGNKFFALDAVCFHFGGPLIQGDIEELPSGKMCIVCPWHRYKINLESGRQIQRELGGNEKESDCQMQRIHHTKVEDGVLYVLLHLDEKELASDSYANMGLYNFSSE